VKSQISWKNLVGAAPRNPWWLLWVRAVAWLLLGVFAILTPFYNAGAPIAVWLAALCASALSVIQITQVMIRKKRTIH